MSIILLNKRRRSQTSDAMVRTWARRLLLLVAATLGSGCSGNPEATVVVYTALDEEFSKPALQDFESTSGVHVRSLYDIESTKTVGLTEAILNESQAGPPRCDVFWNNEILNTIRLQQRGVLDVYTSPAHADYPERFRSPSGQWHGFAARARILIVNTDRVAEPQMPTSIMDLIDDRWKGQVGIAKPLFGSTATHATCLFAVWGDQRARRFFKALKVNDVSIESGNKQVATGVATGRLAFGLTDTDDAMIEIEKGSPVCIVYPDSGPEQLGTLFIPNTVAIIKGSRHPKQARQLVDFLLSPQVEGQLAIGPSAQIPLNPRVSIPSRVKTPAEIKPMDVDFEEAAQSWDNAAEFLHSEF